VAWVPGAVGLKIRPSSDAEFHLVLRRSQRLSLSERQAAEAFCAAFDRLYSEGPSQEHVIGLVPEDVVVNTACSVAKAPAAKGALTAQIAVLRSWASQTYEGQQISAGLAIGTASSDSNLTFGEYHELPAAKVLGDGVTTLCVFDSEGRHRQFAALSEPPRNGDTDFRSPFAFRRVAYWSSRNGRIATCLTRRGELLLFVRGEVTFIHRRGAWLHVNHDGAIATWTKIHDKEGLRGAVYASALDVSFSRSGTCIAVVLGKNWQKIESMGVIQKADFVRPQGAKGRMLATLVDGKRFQDLNREVRRQLLAMDGATILDSGGSVIAAGAIVRVPSGSSGGGRLAATRALAKFGFSVKVSADGEIKAFQGRSKIPVYVGL